jgi:hypothetical protein
LPTKIIINGKMFKDKTNKEKFVKNSFFKKILIKYNDNEIKINIKELK